MIKQQIAHWMGRGVWSGAVVVLVFAVADFGRVDCGVIIHWARAINPSAYGGNL